MPAPRDVEVEVVEDVEENDDNNDEDYEENVDILTEGLDIPSPPSIPSPQPKSRGKMVFRGHGRGQVKGNKANNLIETRQHTAVRRGSRRRTTRFKLDPDDNSGGCWGVKGGCWGGELGCWGRIRVFRVG